MNANILFADYKTKKLLVEFIIYIVPLQLLQTFKFYFRYFNEYNYCKHILFNKEILNLRFILICYLDHLISSNNNFNF